MAVRADRLMAALIVAMIASSAFAQLPRNLTRANERVDFWELASRPPADPFQPWQDMPFLRDDETAVWDAANNRVLYFGGVQMGGPEWGAPASEMDPVLSRESAGFYVRRRLNQITSWTAAEGFRAVPNVGSVQIPARNGAMAVWDGAGSRMIVFGGNVKAGDGEHPTMHNDVWSWTASAGWRELMPRTSASRGIEFDGPPPEAPAPRFGASVVWDTKENRMLVFGGYGVNAVGRTSGHYHYVGVGNDLWEFRPASLTIQRPDRPIDPRNPAAGRPARLPAGVKPPPSGWNILTDRFDPTAPPPRAGAAHAWDSTNNRLLVFGGSNMGLIGTRNPLPSDNRSVAHVFYNDLWSWDAAGGWKRLSPADAPGAPSGRWATGTWDARNNRFLVWGKLAHMVLSDSLYSRSDSNSNNELWEWTDAGGWKRLIAASTDAPRALHRGYTMLFDPAAGQPMLVELGGTTRSIFTLTSRQLAGRRLEDVRKRIELAEPKVFDGLLPPVEPPPEIKGEPPPIKNRLPRPPGGPTPPPGPQPRPNNTPQR